MHNIRLPKTKFEMKANLPQLEQLMLKRWEKMNILNKINEGKIESCYLHYGPPFANGSFHMGHAINMILKDFYMRFESFNGKKIYNKIGFDCHGQPIEKSVKDLIKKGVIKTDETAHGFIKACEKFTLDCIEIQKNILGRLGILKEDKYYSTIESTPEIYEQFSKLLLNDLVYLAKKPVYWSIDEKTTLSEAEIEYKIKRSTAVYVGLKITKAKEQDLLGALLIIWTTTPWTLLDNCAVAYGDLSYGLYDVDGTKILMGKNAVKKLEEKLQEEFTFIRDVNINLMDECEHPLINKSVSIIHGEWVSDNEGSGFVHIAPAHGIDDFILAERYHLDFQDNVGTDGFYEENHESLEKGLAHLHIFKDELKILDALGTKLIYNETIEHSYPHTMRGSIPVIFKSTEQIFIDLSKTKTPDFTRVTEDIIWIPSFLNQTINFIQSRKEWCLSRQRFWGIPLALFITKETREILKDEEVQKRIYEVMKKDSAIFFTDKAYDVLDGLYDKKDYFLYFGTMDCWFESGVSWSYVTNADNFEQADVYLEGKDQIRGWFNSSLITSFLLKEKSPYKKVIGHGFVTDEKQEKMSKSKGNGVDPLEFSNNTGSEILRILVLNSDYTQDIKVSAGLLEKSTEIYKKIRFVMRYLLSINDSKEIILDFKNNKIEFELLEKSILCEMTKMIEQFHILMNNFNVHKAFIILFRFLQNVSAEYFNARKNTLYNDKEDSKSYRSAKCCMYILLKNFLILWAEFLPFTMEEVNDHFIDKEKETVHLYTFKDLILFNDFEEAFNEIKGIRPMLEKLKCEIEILRQKGIIKKNNELSISVPSNIYEFQLLLGIDKITIGDCLIL